MIKFTVLIFAVIACAAARPRLIGNPLAYTGPAAVLGVAAPVVTAASSQVVTRNYNGIATAPIVAPVAAPAAVKSFAPVAPFATTVAAAKTLAAPVAPVATAYSSALAAAFTTPAVPTAPAYSSPLAAAFTTPVVPTAPAYSSPLAAAFTTPVFGRYAAVAPLAYTLSWYTKLL